MMDARERVCDGGFWVVVCASPSLLLHRYHRPEKKYNDVDD
jgi:hypothetical protein